MHVVSRTRVELFMTVAVGPRGLASIVLGLVYLEQESHHAGESTVRFAVMATVLLKHLCSWPERPARYSSLRR